MSILDFFKNKETLTADEVLKLEKEIEALQAKHEQEKQELTKKYEAEKEVFLNDLETKTKDWETEKETLTAEKEKFLAEKVEMQREQAIIEQLRNDGANPKAVKLLKKEIDINGVELDENNNIKNWDNVAGKLKTDYADFFGAPSTEGVASINPPKVVEAEPDPFLTGFKEAY